MEDKIKNTIAFITGGASGIGKAIATRIINHGGRVMIVDVDPAGKEVADSLGDRAQFAIVDVTSEEDITNALNLAKKIFGGINTVINAAGIAMPEKFYDFETCKPHSLDTFKRSLDVNVVGTFNVTRLAAGLIAANSPDENDQRGLIINISSILAHDSPGITIAYSTSKAAVEGMTLPLARTFAPKGIRVVAVAPGFIATPLTLRNTMVLKDDFVRVAVANLCPKRQGRPDEIAHVMQCIIENAFINAEVIRVDAGYRYISPLRK